MVKRVIFIPETPEQLSSEWLTNVLRENRHLTRGKVSEVMQTLIGDGEGFVGDIIKLDLTYDSQAVDGPESIIAKMPKLANRAMGELLGAYERENMFYMTYADSLPVATPRLYYGEFDRDAASEKQEEILRQADKIPKFLQGLTNRLAWWIAAGKKRRYILLIEDISGDDAIDQLAGVDRREMSFIVDAVAKLHAHFWRKSDLAEQFWLLPMNIDAKMRGEMMHRSKAAFADMFSDSIAHGLQPFIDDLSVNGVRYCHELADGPVTLVHGDLRLDNLFFRGEDVVFIDWQLVRRGNPAYDLAYLFSSGLDDEESAIELLEAYYHGLVTCGVSDWSLSNLISDYRTALRVVLMNLSSVDQVELGDGRGQALLKVWIDRLRRRLMADCQN